MEASILDSTKQILGLAPEYTVFDLDILTHINAAFGVIHQLGVGPEEAFFVEGETETWHDLNLHRQDLNLVRSYVFLKVKKLFDPPAMSFMIEAVDKQIAEFEWRLNVNREERLRPLVEEPDG